MQVSYCQVSESTCTNLVIMQIARSVVFSIHCLQANKAVQREQKGRSNYLFKQFGYSLIYCNMIPDREVKTIEITSEHHLLYLQ